MRDAYPRRKLAERDPARIDFMTTPQLQFGRGRFLCYPIARRAATFTTGLGALGLLGWRKKRKQVV
jgi:hypothetical protein